MEITQSELHELFLAQSNLDNDVLTKHNLTHNETIERRYLATLVELGEFAQEWRGFKYWSTDQQPTDHLLDEFVDVLHFALSLTLYHVRNLTKRQVGAMANNINDIVQSVRGSVGRELLHIMRRVAQVQFDNTRFIEYYFVDAQLLGDLFRVGSLVGFTMDEILTAYYQKNSINHDRQKGDY